MESLRNHICLLLDVGKVKNLLEAKGLDNEDYCIADESFRTEVPELCRGVYLSDLVECGEFHVSGGWADQERKALKLIRGSEMHGESCLLIGEYIGPYAYAVDAILRSKELPVTKAMCQVCGSPDAFSVANEDVGEDLTARASDDEQK